MFDSSDEEDVKRVVRSNKDKEYEEIQDIRKRLSKRVNAGSWHEAEPRSVVLLLSFVPGLVVVFVDVV